MRRADPLNFSYVLGSAGISIVFYLTGWNLLSIIFLYLTVISYVGLVGMFLIRLALFGRRFLKEIFNVHDFFDYLIFSSATSALSIRFCLSEYNSLSLGLAWAGAIFSVLIIYTLIGQLLFQEKSSVESISPFWLLISVALHSIGLTITTLWDHGLLMDPIFLVAAVCFWSCAVLFYIMLMALSLYRFFLVSFDVKNISPAYWTCVGAAAIAALDGGRLTLIQNGPSFLEAARPFIEGCVILFWAWAIAWIPLLILMEIFKYGYFKSEFRYHPVLWTMIYPLAMYTLATDHMAMKYQFSFIGSTVPFWIWTTFSCWLLILISIGFGAKRFFK